MMEKQKNIPDLRFPEFKDSWEQDRMGNLYSFKVTNSYSRDNLNYESGVVKNIHYGDIHTKFQTLFDITKEKVPYINLEISINRISNDNYCNEGDIVFADASEDLNDVGKSIEIVHLNGERLLAGLHTILARPFSEKIKVGFGGYLFRSNFIRRQIQKESQGSKVLSISTSRLHKIILTFPSIIEQTKIVKFISAIDQKIPLLRTKRDLLIEYKKGVLQKIFNQEIRFKQDNGQDFPEWEKEPFGSIYSFLSTNSLSRENLTYDTGEVKNIHYGDIHTKFKCQFKVENELVPYVKYDITISRYNEENYCKEGDLIFADASEDYDDIGKAIEIVSTNAEKILSGLHTIHARPESNRMEVGFAAYLMQSSFVRREIMRISQGTKVLSISATRLKDVLIKVPHKDEQLKIANLLAALDLKIESLDSQIVGMESWKKGLLQKMFC